MPAGTNSVRRIQRGMNRSPNVTPPSRAIAPPGNRSLQPTIKRAPREPHDRRSYGKGVPTGGMFDLPGFEE